MVIVRFESLSAPQHPKEFSHLIGERLWLLQRGEMAAARHDTPPPDVAVGPRRQRPGRADDLARKLSVPRRNLQVADLGECRCARGSKGLRRTYWFVRDSAGDRYRRRRRRPRLRTRCSSTFSPRRGHPSNRSGCFAFVVRSKAQRRWGAECPRAGTFGSSAHGSAPRSSGGSGG
jgi:hypothetical protein